MDCEPEESNEKIKNKHETIIMSNIIFIWATNFCCSCFKYIHEIRNFTFIFIYFYCYHHIFHSPQMLLFVVQFIIILCIGRAQCVEFQIGQYVENKDLIS